MQPGVEMIYHANALHLKGELNFDSVPELFEKSLPYLEKQRELTIDFAGIHATNSAGLALILEWRKYAHQKKQHLKFVNLPQTLLTIAKVADLEQLLY